jgi:hypothetical protein
MFLSGQIVRVPGCATPHSKQQELVRPSFMLQLSEFKLTHIACANSQRRTTPSLKMLIFCGLSEDESVV